MNYHHATYSPCAGTQTEFPGVDTIVNAYIPSLKGIPCPPRRTDTTGGINSINRLNTTQLVGVTVPFWVTPALSLAVVYPIVP
jgi:hypothetical protein